MAEHVILGAFLGCLLGGFLPWINSEVIVAGSAMLLAADQLVVLAVAGAAGQMAAKVGVYALARWTPERLPKRLRGSLGKAQKLRRSRWATVLLVLASATVSLPPFYLVTLAAGMVRVPFAVFAGVGLAGTTLRYGILIVGATAVSRGAIL